MPLNLNNTIQECQSEKVKTFTLQWYFQRPPVLVLARCSVQKLIEIYIYMRKTRDIYR